MLTIFGATPILTKEILVLFAALAALLLGIALIIIDVMRRNQRRREAENRPIDTSRFQHASAAEAAAEAPPAEAMAPHAPQPAATPAGEAPAGAMPAEAAPLAAAPDPFFAGAPDSVAAAVPESFAAAVPDSFVPAVPDSFAAAVPDSFVPAVPAGAPPAPLAPLPAYSILVCSGYGAGFGSRIVLADVTFAVPDQGITTLMGPAGTGKSTLLRALAGLLNQSGLFKDWGYAYFRGAPLAADNRPLLVTQRIQLVQRSALENMTFHLRDRAADLTLERQRDWATQWLTQAGVDQIIPMLDQRFIELDQLSQRIVTILREAVAEPALLLIDEPTIGLAEADAAVLLAMLERLAAYTPLLLVLQNQKQAQKISNQIILLAGGRVQADCPAREFFTAPPNPAVAEFIATGTCTVAPPETVPINPVELSPPPPPLTADSLAAIKTEIRNTLAAELTAVPEPAALAPAGDAESETLEGEPLESEALESEALESEALESEIIIAERVSAPLPHDGDAGAPLFIDMVPEDEGQEDEGQEDGEADDLPPISLGAQMMQAAMHHPDGGSPGPRGFVWIEENRLAATPMPGIAGPAETDLALLKAAGITALITLTEEDLPPEQLARHGLRNRHFPIAGNKAPSTAETDTLLNEMRDMLAQGEVLAVHCLAGLGPTGTVLAAYMVKEQGVSAEVALNHIRRFNQQFVQTDDEEDFLTEYEVQQEQAALLSRASGGGKSL